jgi:hypothetical protein
MCGESCSRNYKVEVHQCNVSALPDDLTGPLSRHVFMPDRLYPPVLMSSSLVSMGGYPRHFAAFLRASHTGCLAHLDICLPFITKSCRCARDSDAQEQTPDSDAP